MQRYKLVLAYNGTRFQGWQHSDNGRSVEDAVAKAVAPLMPCLPLHICGSGRTDSGVHALGQVCHVDILRVSKPRKAVRPALEGEAEGASGGDGGGSKSSVGDDSNSSDGVGAAGIGVGGAGGLRPVRLLYESDLGFRDIPPYLSPCGTDGGIGGGTGGGSGAGGSYKLPSPSTAAAGKTGKGASCATGSSSASPTRSTATATSSSASQPSSPAPEDAVSGPRARLIDLSRVVDSIPARNLLHLLNTALGRDTDGAVRVLSVNEVPPYFHARYSALRRRYVYRIAFGDVRSVFEQDRAWCLDSRISPADIDLPAMLEAADILQGTHDFSSFRNTHCQARSPVRTIESIRIGWQHSHADAVFAAAALGNTPNPPIPSSPSSCASSSTASSASAASFSSSHTAFSSPTAPAAIYDDEAALALAARIPNTRTAHHPGLYAYAPSTADERLSTIVPHHATMTPESRSAVQQAAASASAADAAGAGAVDGVAAVDGAVGQDHGAAAVASSCGSTSVWATSPSSRLPASAAPPPTVLTVTVTAQSFLHSQVRLFVGCLVDVALGKITPQRVREVLLARSRAANTSPPAPPQGLYLAEVEYPQTAEETRLRTIHRIAQMPAFWKSRAQPNPVFEARAITPSQLPLAADPPGVVSATTGSAATALGASADALRASRVLLAPSRVTAVVPGALAT